MQMIDRYEISMAGHMRLVDARSALNHLERLVKGTEGSLDRNQLDEKLELLVEALNDAADDTRPVDGQDVFMRRACELNYMALSPKEREILQLIRTSNNEGQAEIFQMIAQTQDRLPAFEPQR